MGADQALAEAQSAVGRGWAVVPVAAATADGACKCRAGRDCPKPGKHPITSNGYRDASSDLAQVRVWATSFPGCNWGVVASRSGLAILDRDPRNGGDETLLALTGANGPLPDTVRVLTGGGTHDYFIAPSGIEPHDVVIGPGLELKSLQYVVLPGSMHASGRRYQWEAGYSPDDIGIDPLPAFLTERLRPGSPDQNDRRSMPPKRHDVRQWPALNWARLTSHLEPGTTLYAIWHCQGRYGHGDQSRLDLALFRDLKRLGYAVEDAQPVLAEFRRINHSDVSKAWRTDYVVGTWDRASVRSPETGSADPLLLYERSQAVEAAYRLRQKIFGLKGDLIHCSALEVMAHYMARDGTCFMGQKRLATELNRTGPTASRTLDWLMKHSFLKRISDGRRGRGIAACYRLVFYTGWGPPTK